MQRQPVAVDHRLIQNKICISYIEIEIKKAALCSLFYFLRYGIAINVYALL